LAEHPNQNPEHPSTDLPPAYCHRCAPEQPAEAARRSLAADCESAGSTVCLLAAATLVSTMAARTCNLRARA
jgi:hypothetical protein